MRQLRQRSGLGPGTGNAAGAAVGSVGRSGQADAAGRAGAEAGGGRGGAEGKGWTPAGRLSWGGVTAGADVFQRVAVCENASFLDPHCPRLLPLLLLLNRRP